MEYIAGIETKKYIRPSAVLSHRLHISIDVDFDNSSDLTGNDIMNSTDNINSTGECIACSDENTT